MTVVCTQIRDLLCASNESFRSRRMKLHVVIDAINNSDNTMHAASISSRIRSVMVPVLRLSPMAFLLYTKCMVSMYYVIRTSKYITMYYCSTRIAL